MLLPKPEVSVEISEREAIPTAELWDSDSLRHRSELQWRLSLPLLVFVVTVMAVPLARVNPRQGRFLKLLPAILLYMAYLSLLIAARGSLDKGRLPASLGLWWGARAVPADRARAVVLGAAEAVATPNARGSGGRSWVSSIGTSRST